MIYFFTNQTISLYIYIYIANYEQSYPLVHEHNYGKSPFLLRELTISVGIFQFANYIAYNNGWWFGTFELFFHSVGNVIIPIDEQTYCSRDISINIPIFCHDHLY